MPRVPRSLKALISELVDYAGLFPPAGLEMDAAVRNYSHYRTGKNAWMLGRFVVPVARLDEMVAAAQKHKATGLWPLSALVGEDHAGDFERIVAFNEAHAHPNGFIIDTAEVKASSPGRIAEIAVRVPPRIHCYVEVPVLDGDPRPLIKVIAASRLRAKIRTGGLTQDAFPSSDAVSRFIRACYGLGVPIKATAGLHHPLRGAHPLTYDIHAETGMMHGFLNVFLAAAFCYNGLGAGDAPRLLEVGDVSEISFDDKGVSWRDYRLSTAELITIRKRFATTFGSCSFDEPVGDLKMLNLL